METSCCLGGFVIVLFFSFGCVKNESVERCTKEELLLMA